MPNKVETETKLPSTVQMEDKVNICLGLSGIIKNGFVMGIRFSDDKIFYDVAIQVDHDEFTLLQNIEESLVEKI